jgi:hypothetical protein
VSKYFNTTEHDISYDFGKPGQVLCVQSQDFPKTGQYRKGCQDILVSPHFNLVISMKLFVLLDDVNVSPASSLAVLLFFEKDEEEFLAVG